jgi:uncharacterized protein
MSDYRSNAQTRNQTQVTIDQGLRSYMLKVYNYMGAGLAITGVAAYGTYNAAVDAAGQLTPLGLALFTSPLKYLVIFAPLAMVMFLSFRVHRMSVAAAQATFWIYAALVGVSLSSIGMIYAASSITQIFFITAATFATVSLYGYTTKRDLTGFGSFLIMGLIGLVIASIVNVFMQSSAMSFVLSAIGVLVFTGLTAWDTQKIKEVYFEGDDTATMGRKAIMGALNLYLDFINLFLSLLRMFGSRD